jgi:hypothetical protein
MPKAKTNPELSKLKQLCTMNDKAFALLLCWKTVPSIGWIFSNYKGSVMQQSGVRQCKFFSDIPTMYTKGGILHDKTNIAQLVKGWRPEGIVHFNGLFDQVRKDYAGNPDFERNWLEAPHSTQEEGATPKSCLNQIMKTILHQLQLRSLWMGQEVRLTKRQIRFQQELITFSIHGHRYGSVMIFRIHTNHIII